MLQSPSKCCDAQARQSAVQEWELITGAMISRLTSEFAQKSTRLTRDKLDIVRKGYRAVVSIGSGMEPYIGVQKGL